MLKQSLISIFVLAAVGATAQASAADSNFYGVFSLGRAKLDADGTAVDTFNLNNGFASSITTSQTGTNGGKAQLGYTMGKTFAVEGGYTYLGKADFVSVTNLGTIGGSKDASLFNLDLVGKLPLNEKWAVLGRFGGYYWKTKNEMPNAATLGTSTFNDNGWDFKMGAGVQYEFTPKFSMRSEFERFNGIGKSSLSGDSKVNQLTVGAVLMF
jgi:OOP family OmpA-OmpF porin